MCVCVCVCVCACYTSVSTLYTYLVTYNTICNAPHVLCDLSKALQLLCKHILIGCVYYTVIALPMVSVGMRS